MITETSLVTVEMSQTAPVKTENAMHRSSRMAAEAGFATAAIATAGGLYALTKKPWASLGALVGFGLVRWQMTRLFTQAPEFVDEVPAGLLEMRQYPELLVAQTTIKARSWREALDEGFIRLVDHVPTMTVPVISTVLGDEYTIAFLLPEGATLASLPVPDDVRVIFRRIPAMRVAVMRFEGAYDGASLLERCKEIYRYAQVASLEAVGEPLFAGYDPPSTLPLLRRQELWLPVNAES